MGARLRPHLFDKIESGAWMSATETKFKLDGLSYKIADLSDEGRDILQQLIFARTNLLELRNQHALLSKAKNAYIGDLKSDIVEGKSGVDLGALFSDDEF